MTPSHFGEWMQGRLGPDGPVVLVTLGCPLAAIDVGTGAAVPGVDALCKALAIPDPGRRVTPRFPPGGGCGVSTASLLAVAGAGDPDRLARACVAAEGATDPLMWPTPDALLWAPREGRILQRGPRPPHYEVVGGFFGPPTPTIPKDVRFPDIADLVRQWAAGQPLPELASESARRTTTMRGPAGDPTEALATALGALGHARAHTGSARALIFPVGHVPDNAEATLRGAGLADPLRFITGYAP